jgi:hypothetical protein
MVRSTLLSATAISIGLTAGAATGIVGTGRTLVGRSISIGGDVVAENGLEVPPERRGVNMAFQSYAA